MHVAGLQADPVHRRQVPDRIGGMGVLDQLGLGGRPRREVEEQRVGGHRHGVWRERRVDVTGVGVAQPAVNRLTDCDPCVRTRHVVELGRVRRRHDDMTGVAALHAVDEIQQDRASAWRG